MSEYDIPKTPSAYEFPLLIRHLLSRLSAQHAGQEICYGNDLRFSYAEFFDRVQRLASGLQSLGIGPGDTVAVMDWDSHRYLECFFAVPMIGAVLSGLVGRSVSGRDWLVITGYLAPFWWTTSRTAFWHRSP